MKKKHSEFSVRANSCNKLFKSVFMSREIACDTVIKMHLRPRCPLLKGKRAMPPSCPFSGVHDVTLRYNVRSCDIRKTLNVELHLRIQRPQLGWLDHLSKMPREMLGGKSCRLHPQERGQEIAHGPGEVITSSTFLGPVLELSQKNYLRLLLVMKYLARVLIRLLPPWPSPEEKRAGKWMKKWIFKAQYILLQRSMSSSTFKPASTFYFHGNRCRLSDSKCP